jgi:hypothetical protein
MIYEADGDYYIELSRDNKEITFLAFTDFYGDWETSISKEHIQNKYVSTFYSETGRESKRIILKRIFMAKHLVLDL